MKRMIWNSLWLTPTLLGAAAIATMAAPASIKELAQPEQTVSDDVAQVQLSVPPAPVQMAELPTAATDSSVDGMESLTSVGQLASDSGVAAEQDQVTSVSQLTDVRPTDWAFQALQSLVERYGCIVGYPDRTYRGNRPLSRYEFAAGVNACLDRISELIDAAKADLVTKEDLLVVQRLQEEFAAEIAMLRGKIDSIEVRTTTLERQQFSTTTKLSGEIIFGIADTFGDAVGQNDDRTETIFSDRVRLTFDSSFTGRDRLRTRLQARNTPNFANTTGTNMTRLSFDGDEGNDVGLDELFYRFPLNDRITLQIDATNIEFYDSLISPVSALASSGSGSISRFGRFNPVYRGPGGAGINANVRLSDAFSLQLGYSANNNSNEPGLDATGRKRGLFGGSYEAIAQLVFKGGSNFEGALFYTRNYFPGNDVDLTGGTGSALARRPFGNRATNADSFGASAQFKLSPQFILGGWYGIQFANDVVNGNDATVQNGAIYAAFPDLGRKGNLGALLVGVPPKATDNDAAGREDTDTSFHVEALYRIRVNDNISITPGVFVLFNPEHNDANDTQIVGVIRTTFTF